MSRKINKQINKNKLQLEIYPIFGMITITEAPQNESDFEKHL